MLSSLQCRPAFLSPHKKTCNLLVATLFILIALTTGSQQTPPAPFVECRSFQPPKQPALIRIWKHRLPRMIL
uniref:Uncharacterized protein n=1 Tax=Arundo donax TaxID=35708 RepID=A0A0A8ZQ82_ARUDO